MIALAHILFLLIILLGITEFHEGTQLKVVDFDQSSSPVLAAPTLRLIVTIDTTYHITIDIVHVTNALHNDLKD